MFIFGSSEIFKTEFVESNLKCNLRMELCRLKVLLLADRFLKMPEVQKTIISLENLKSSKRKFKKNG